MTEEKKDLQGLDPNASEPLKDEQAAEAEAEHTEEAVSAVEADGQAPEAGHGESAEQPESGTGVPVTGLESSSEALAVMQSEDEIHTQAAEEPPVKRNNSGIWMGVSLILVVLLVISLFTSPFAQKDSEKAVATVNNEKITKEQLYDALVKAGGEQTLSGMIDDELIRQEAVKANVEVTDADIQKEKDFYITQFGSEEALNELLSQYGMTDEDFQEQLKKEAQIRKLLEPQVTVTDDQISTYFEQNKASFDTPAQVQASQIVVATEKEATDIITQLKGGTDFATLAKEKSTDTATKDNGGDLGFFAQDSGTVDSAVVTAAFNLKKDGISSAVQMSDGQYAVVKVTDTKEAHTATLEEKKAEIKDLLITQQVSSMSTSWLDNLRAEAKITNTLDSSSSEETAADSSTTTAE
ncbi:peptidyl-prolyl cis-trans isomerase [Paenibacillus pinistramenti]|uniref:peptidyl-prolyl cis-trans isomerase n=1 Tax=Paenibacillus pinistramenti TaxID=1768003 RepID=UPI0011090CA4|nr:peptidyl-prolyl cis-trans isomerase [Paenibacillus pinistramenti]